MGFDLYVLRAETMLETLGLLKPCSPLHICMSESLVLASTLPMESCVTLGKSPSWELFPQLLTQIFNTYIHFFLLI